MDSPGRKVAIVADDNEGVANVLTDLLSELGVLILRAGSGPEALALAAVPGTQLLLLDVMLPGLDGYGVLAQLRGEPWGRDLPVVVLTGETGEDHDAIAEAFGAGPVIRKPFDVDAVSRRLRELLGLAEAGTAA